MDLPWGGFVRWISSDLVSSHWDGEDLCDYLDFSLCFWFPDLLCFWGLFWNTGWVKNLDVFYFVVWWISIKCRDAKCSIFAVFSTFFKLQILVILSKMPQNTLFSRITLCTLLWKQIKNTVFQAKILFFHPQKYFFFRKRVGISVNGIKNFIDVQFTSFLPKCRKFTLITVCFYFLFYTKWVPLFWWD